MSHTQYLGIKLNNFGSLVEPGSKEKLARRRTVVTRKRPCDYREPAYNIEIYPMDIPRISSRLWFPAEGYDGRMIPAFSLFLVVLCYRVYDTRKEPQTDGRYRPYGYNISKE